jgi:hypothetical protein
VATLDNWCGWISSSLPGLSKFVQSYTPSAYRGARVGALNALKSSAIHQALAATYNRVLVDEYQDCDKLQHELVCKLAESIPVVALGDPLQRVFDFSPDGLPRWADVVATFGTVWTMDFPWRWHNAGERNFGNWILDQRKLLEAEGQIDFRKGLSNVKWLPLPAEASERRSFCLSCVPRPRTGTTLFVLTDRSETQARRSFARDSVRLAVVENADLPDLMNWARIFERVRGMGRVEKLVNFAHDMMTGVDVAAIVGELNKVVHVTVGKTASDEEKLLLALANGTIGADLSHALERMAAKRTVYRPELMEAFCQAARLATSETDRTLTSAAEFIRDKRASEGRRVGPRAIGSTLLLKGLEADHTVVIDADEMKATDLYVAISRGARSLTVVSRSPILPV